VDSPRKSLLSRLSHWAAELLLVFLGAYAAFWLTNYQQHRADVHRLLTQIQAERHKR
jgi:hypothetical protein